MIKTLLLLMSLCRVTKANYSVTCNDSLKQGVYFDPTYDNVKGRYIVKWCIERDVSADLWEVHIKYGLNKTPMTCNRKTLPSGRVHSIFEENVQSTCKYICLAKDIDLVFNATCYHIETKLSAVTSNGYSIKHINNSYYYVSDSYPMDKFINSKTYVEYSNDGNDTVINWYLGYVPATDYIVEVYVNDSSVDVSHSCSTLGARQSHVQCRVRVDPGCYTAILLHKNPWTSAFRTIKGPFENNFCHERAPPELQRAERAEQWWALGVALALLLLGALLFGLRRARLALELRRCTRRQWLAGDKRAPSGPATDASAGRVLLLYARDSAHVSRAAQLLARLLRHCTGYEVVDLYSPEAVSAAAPAGGEWLRALLADAATRVLLLQTPATGLYRARLAPSASGSPTLEAPLLSQQVMWRCPHAADPLLQLALRLLTETAHAEPLPYKKYYVASIAGVQHYEAVPAVTPLRRYLLPHATDHLLDHIAAPLASPPTSPSSENAFALGDGPDPLLSSPESSLTGAELPTASLDLPPSASEEPPPAPETCSADPERSRLLQQLWSTLEEFRCYAMDNPNYLFANLVCE